MKRMLYLVLCVLVCVTPLALVVLFLGMRWPLDDDTLFAAIALLLISVLTYPAGVIGTVFCLGMIWSGLVTPTETIALSAPIFAGAGYLQWYVILPKVYGRNRGAGESQVPT